MTTIPITMIIDIDKAAAIRAGRAGYGKVAVPVPVDSLTPDEREILIACPSTSLGDGQPAHLDPYRDGQYRIALPPVVDTSLDSIRAVLHARAEKLRADREKAASEREASIIEALAAPADAWIGPGRGRAYYTDLEGHINSTSSGVKHTEPTVRDAPEGIWLDDDERRDPRIIARRQEIERDHLPAALAKWEENYTEWQRRVAEREAREQAGIDALRAWAADYGSDRLRLMLQMGVGDWHAVAKREYQDAHAPEGYERGSHGGAVRRKPTLAELQELQRLQALVEGSDGVLSDPTIDWVTREDSYDDETGDLIPGDRYAVAEVRVWSPCGDSAWYAKRIDQ